jgi:hypothetical protein
MTKLLFFIFLWAQVIYGTEDLSKTIVSVDGFKKLADFVFEEKDSFDPDQIFEGAVIFVKTNYLGYFFKKKFPRIKNRFIIISHEGDYPAPRRHKKYLEHEKLIAWLGQNPTVKNEKKFLPIPIGVAGSNWAHGNMATIKNIQDKETEKLHLAYLNINTGTYPIERERVYNLFCKEPYCLDTGRCSFEKYLQDMKASRFVFSPRGNGLDCHRTWEALLMGSIPIVGSSYLDPLLEDLPVLIVKNWEEITEAFLIKTWREISETKYSLDKLYLQYYKDLIDDILEKEGIVR